MKFSMMLPAMVRMDKVCAMFMEGNVTVISHTKHVNIYYMYVNEYAKMVW